jgi:hypothetical protein
VDQEKRVCLRERRTISSAVMPGAVATSIR